MFIMNRLSLEKRAQVVKLLVEGVSMRATARVADVSLNTVTRLLVEIGSAALDYQDRALRRLPCRRIQMDEIWSFVGAKERNASDEQKAGGFGDIWTWTAICADTKLVPCWHVGERNTRAARLFVSDVANRLAHRVQLTTDGHQPYLRAVEDAFGANIDYAVLEKIYGQTEEGQRRYSPPECIGTKVRCVVGDPDPAHISTSYVERQNLTMRMSMRRFTRLTNGFSKKVENHMHAISLHFMHYNFGRIHKTLRVTPAMEAGLADHVWSVEEIVNLVPEPIAKKRGPYKKRAIEI